MTLSKRLQAVADMVTPGLVVADIGTDHGYVPIYLTKNNIVPKAYAMDINKGPIERANKNIEGENLQDKIITIQSNGMEKLKPNMAESVVIAGMGGELMIDIIKNSPVIGELKELILSPHSEIDYVRKTMLENNWKIVDEEMVKDNKKYYTVMKLIPGREQNEYSRMELIYGRYLIEKKSDTFIEYLDREYNKYTEILNVLEDNFSVIGRNIEIRQLRKLNRKARGLLDG